MPPVFGEGERYFSLSGLELLLPSLFLNYSSILLSSPLLISVPPVMPGALLSLPFAELVLFSRRGLLSRMWRSFTTS